MKSDYKSGVVILLITQIIWGVLPVYWQTLIPINSFVIILYRIVTMLITCYLYMKIIVRQENLFAELVESRKSFFTYLAAGVLITINWSVFIWAINDGRVIDASMGYYIEPLMICAIGRFAFNEKLNGWKKVALLLGVIAIVVMIIGYGQLPLVSLVLAISFSLYATIKKTVKIHPVKSMLYETLFVAPFAFVILIRSEFTELGAFQVEEKYKFVLLLFAGAFSLVPLVGFSMAARKLTLVTLGVMAYISPSLSIIIGVIWLNEEFDVIKFTSMFIVWVAIVFFTVGEIRESKKQVLKIETKNEQRNNS